MSRYPRSTSCTCESPVPPHSIARTRNPTIVSRHSAAENPAVPVPKIGNAMLLSFNVVAW
jgi:hypothetical protein